MGCVRYRFLIFALLISANFGCTEQTSSEAIPVPNKSASYKQLLADPAKKLVGVWRYPGGEMDEAEMYFWNNGLLVISSEIFLEKKSENYFFWAINKDQTLLSISYVDERAPLKTSATTETYFLGRTVKSIDPKTETVTYVVEARKSIFFNNWRFSGEPLERK
jgi:hypothetical protein